LLRSAVKTRFFPDRLIFFLYLCGLIPFLWTSLHRACTVATSSRSTSVRMWLFSWTATLAVLTYALYPLLAFRFIVYEETIAYFVVAELYAVSMYVRFLDSKRTVWICGVAAAAGVGLLIRPTGLPYLALWGALVFLNQRSWRTVIAFGAGAAPIVGFWLYSNWVRSGSPLAFGYQNSLPEYPFHYAIIRFGGQCAATPKAFWQGTKALFDSFFVKFPELTPEMNACHFQLEPGYAKSTPYFGPAVLVILVGSLLYRVTRRPQRIEWYLPHAVFVALFVAYARLAGGFAYRYVGDFWPLVILILVQLAPAALLQRHAVASNGLALVFAIYSATVLLGEIEPARATIETINAAQLAAADAEYLHTISTSAPPLPSSLVCGKPLPSWPRAQGRGWGPMCMVDTVTNVFLGVPQKPDPIYRLRFKTDRSLGERLQVYVNGRIHTAHLESNGPEGATYLAEFRLDVRKLYSPAIMITVRWTEALVPPAAKLSEIELA
jgi:hypothetical protein